MKKVPREEYLQFIADFPLPLVGDVCGIPYPPLESLNDFSDGKVWPESMVAKHFQGTNDYWILDQ